MSEPKVNASAIRAIFKNRFVSAIALFASLGGFLFAYDQGVMSEILVMNKFLQHFPKIGTNTSFKGWVVSILTFGAWFGALINGPLCDRFSRKRCILLATGAFILESVIQAAAQGVNWLLGGRFGAGIGVGMLSMAVSLYQTELAPAGIRGALVSLQQFAITLGIFSAFWLEFDTHYWGGNGAKLKHVEVIHELHKCTSRNKKSQIKRSPIEYVMHFDRHLRRSKRRQRIAPLRKRLFHLLTDRCRWGFSREQSIMNLISNRTETNLCNE